MTTGERVPAKVVSRLARTKSTPLPPRRRRRRRRGRRSARWAQPLFGGRRAASRRLVGRRRTPGAGSRRADAWATQARARRRGRHRTRAASSLRSGATLPTLRADIVAELRPATRRRDAVRAPRGPPASTEPPRARLARATRRGSRDARGRPRTRGEGRNLALQPRSASAAAARASPACAALERDGSGRRALSGTADERPGRRSATRRARRGRRNQRVHDGRRAREHLVRCVRREPAASYFELV